MLYRLSFLLFNVITDSFLAFLLEPIILINIFKYNLNIWINTSGLNNVYISLNLNQSIKAIYHQVMEYHLKVFSILSYLATLLPLVFCKFVFLTDINELKTYFYHYRDVIMPRIFKALIDSSFLNILLLLRPHVSQIEKINNVLL